MRKIYLIIFLKLLLSNGSFSQEANWEWVKQFGGLNGQSGKALEIDVYGNVYVTGSFWTEAVFDNDTLISNGNYDGYIAKYDNSSNLLWVNHIGSSTKDSGHDIAIDQLGNVYLTGKIGGIGDAYFGNTSVYVQGDTDIFLAKYNSSGELLWVETSGGNYFSENSTSYDCGRAVSTDNANNVYLTGSFKDTAFFSNDTLFSYGGVDMFVAKYNEGGELIWVDNYGSADADNGCEIKIDNNNNIYIQGWFENTFAIADTILYLQDEMDNFILKLSPNGERLWISQFGGSDAYSYKTSLVLDHEDNLFVTDYFSGTIHISDTTISANQNIDFYISKYDPNGNQIWIKQYFDVFNISSNSICLDSNKNLYITGTYIGELYYQNIFLLSHQGNNDIFVSKFDENGKFQWIKSAGGIENERGNDIACVHEGIYITGRFNDEVVFDNETLISDGSHDGYIAKLVEVSVHVEQTINDFVFELSPNPVSKILAIKGIDKAFKYKIYTLQGQMIEEGRIENEISIEHLTEGFYLLQIRSLDGKQKFTYKFVKQ